MDHHDENDEDHHEENDMDHHDENDEITMMRIAVPCLSAEMINTKSQ